MSDELCVLADLGGLTGAIPARMVARLSALADAVLEPKAAGAVEAHPALLGAVVVGGERFAAWDLGLLLGRPHEAQAWVALRLEGPAGSVRVALRTGRCSAVRSISTPFRLPRTLFLTRGEALQAAFPIAAAGELPAGIGVLLDPELLLREAERAASRRLLAAA